MNVVAPDGTLVTDVPEGTTKAQFLERWQRGGGKMPEAAAEPTPTAMAVPTGIAKGASALAGFPGDMMSLLQQVLPSTQLEYGAHLPTTKEIREGVGNLTGMSLPKQTTTTGKYLESGTEGLVSSLLPPITKAGAVVGTLAGLGGEAGEQALGSSEGRLAGAALPIGIASWMAGRKPAAVKTLQDTIEGIGPEEIKRAQAVSDEIFKQTGTRPSLTQVLQSQAGTETPLSSYSRAIRASPQGNELRDAYAAADAKSREMVSDFGGSVSGQDLSAAKEDILRDVVNKAPKTSVVAKLAGPGDIYEKAGAVFGNPSRYSPADVGTLADSLNLVDPKAFPLLYKQWAMGHIGKALESSGGRLVPGSGADAAEAIAGIVGSPQRAQFDAAMRGIARAKGIDPDQYATVAAKFMDAARTLGTEQGAISVSHGLEEGSKSWLSSGLRAFGIYAPFRGIGTSIERATQRRVMERLTDALTSDEGAKILMSIGSTGMTSRRMNAVVRALVMGDVQMQDVASQTP